MYKFKFTRIHLPSLQETEDYFYAPSLLKALETINRCNSSRFWKYVLDINFIERIDV